MDPSGRSLIVAAALGVAVLIGLQFGLWWLFGRLYGVILRRVQWLHGWAREHPLKAALADKAPRWYRFLSARLTPAQFSGLPLTLMVVAAVYAAFLVFGIADMVLASDGVVAVDQTVFGWCAPWRSAAWVSVGLFVTGLGNTSTVVAVMLVVTGMAWAYARRGLIGPMWVQFLGCEIVTTLAKYGIDRARPVFTTIATATSPSFPSGHTTGSAAVYGFVAYAIARDLPSSWKRFAIGYWAVVAIVLVGASRVFLGVHFFSDVVAGYLIGVFWLLVGFAMAEHARSKPRTATTQRAGNGRPPMNTAE